MNLNVVGGSKATWKGSWFFPAKSLPEAGPELEATRPRGARVPLKDASVPQAFQDSQGCRGLRESRDGWACPAPKETPAGQGAQAYQVRPPSPLCRHEAKATCKEAFTPQNDEQKPAGRPQGDSQSAPGQCRGGTEGHMQGPPLSEVWCSPWGAWGVTRPGLDRPWSGDRPLDTLLSRVQGGGAPQLHIHCPHHRKNCRLLPKSHFRKADPRKSRRNGNDTRLLVPSTVFIHTVTHGSGKETHSTARSPSGCKESVKSFHENSF